MNKKRFIELLAGVGLVSGTTIGAGTLALPTSTAIPGFLPTVLIFFFAWIFMAIGALLLLEINQWFPGEKNLISMSYITLGNAGKIFAWVSYLLLLYGLISAYLAALGAWVVTVPPELFNMDLSSSAFGFTHALLLIALLGSILLYCGMSVIDRVNRYLMIVLIVSYGLLVWMVAPYAKPVQLLEQINLPAAQAILPLVLTTFGFAIIVPSLNAYFKRDVKLLKQIILWGSLVPLIVYIVWEYCILGSIPLNGAYGLKSMVADNQHLGITQALSHYVTRSPWLIYNAHLFYVCIVLTSFLGVSFSLLHFLEDGLKLQAENLKHRFILVSLTYVPPLLIMLINPRSFDRILGFSGIFVAAILGILPTLMAWRGRYGLKLKGPFKVWGGKPLLFITLLFFCYVIVLELINCWGA
jgi:tyrosine-specific transport protein